MPSKNNKSVFTHKEADFRAPVNPDFRAKKAQKKSREEITEGIKSGSRTMLSKAITMIESSKEEDRTLGQEILEACVDRTGNSLRIGITGVPGVGKSTFIEAMGQLVLEQGKKLAVLAIDPTSSRSKGSILADKTRMPVLSAHPDVFIRPSPTSGALGGVAGATRETMLLCEAAGFDILFIETTGVGQSETAVHSMVDFFLLLMLAGAGDELQGIKRGIMEMADLVAINKADGENRRHAERAKRELKNALSFFPVSSPGWTPPVHTCSALQGEGVDEIWENIQDYIKQTKENGLFEQRRSEQASRWMYETIHQQLKERFYKHPGVKKRLRETEKRVRMGEISSFKAALELLRDFGE